MQQTFLHVNFFCMLFPEKISKRCDALYICPDLFYRLITTGNDCIISSLLIRQNKEKKVLKISKTACNRLSFEAEA